MNSEKLKRYVNGFTDSTLVPFNCPFCSNPSLALDKDSLVEYDTSKYHEHADYSDPEDCIEYIYHSTYSCLNQVCKQKVFSSGLGKVEVDYPVGEFGEPQKEYFTVYTPKIFLPAFHFFEIPKDTPQEIKDLLILSFSLVLQSPAAAVNSLRSTLEELLDAHQIESKQGLQLHDRIEHKIPESSDLYPYLECLMAIKWLGNTGSHGGYVGLDDIFDVYEIMELILNGVYSKDQMDLMQKARLINSLKRPLNRQERKSLNP